MRKAHVMVNDVQVFVRGSAPLVVLDLQGEVTSFADQAITGAYRTAVDMEARYLLLNCSAVTYMNSAGISIIIGLVSNSRKSNHQLLVCGLTPHYGKIFDILGIARYAQVFDTEEAARLAVDAAHTERSAP